MKVPMISFTLILLLILSTSFPEYEAAAVPDNGSDKLALLAFKSQISDDPLGVLSSWNDSSHFCNWTGVTCGFQIPRVVGLNLTRKNLAGNISPHVGNFSYMRHLDLSVNFLNGEIPKEVCNLGRVRVLNISNNLLGGRIPVNLSNCTRLTNLALDHNLLSGSVPPEIGSLSSSLITLKLGKNNLTGTFPSSFGNLTYLLEMNLNWNYLTSEIPSTISQLKNLRTFWVSKNHFSGEFPPSLYNLTTLESIALAGNNFIGNLRNDIGLVLPNLKLIIAGGNFFLGPIPSTLSNSSKLSFIDLSFNNFTGKVPLDLGRLELRWLGFAFNNLGTGEPGDLDFIISLTNCSNLEYLAISANGFGGQFPVSISNLSTELTQLYFDQNLIRGSIPGHIVRLQKLQMLSMFSNHLSGTIPDSLGMLPNLRILGLHSNHLTGYIPPSIGNISSLLRLGLANNRLRGSIPSSLANLKQLVEFWVAENNFTGKLPEEIMTVSSLLFFNVSFNSLTGPLPKNVGNLSTIFSMDLSYNKFFGEIPNTLDECLTLVNINLRGNYFQGRIPNLARLHSLQYLDLSCNNFSGNIPDYLGSLPYLLYLNLSFNNLEGEIPSSKGVFSNVSAIDARENHKLCGGISELHLPTCRRQASTKEKNKHGLKHVKLILLIVIPSFAALSLFLFLIFLKKQRSKKSPESVSTSKTFFPKISYNELLTSTNGFSSENLIGVGGFGSVYKGTLGLDGTEVAVKVLKLERKGASKSFMAECLALKNIRHNNLVKMITACSSVDFNGNDFKALVYQLMPNGSLDSWLHPEEETTCYNRLNILQRINIVIDVASALYYLHHECETQVVHCDLKPQNVLLDNDLIAHVGDFGLARLIPKFIGKENENQSSSLGIKGTIGYAAPEYAMGLQASTMGDVYSFGILLMEIFTGKRPTDNLFQENLNLHNLVQMAIPEKVMDVLDNSALCEEGWSNLTNERRECLIRVLKIGVACSIESPQDRKSMREVRRELSIIRDNFSRNLIEDEKKLSLSKMTYGVLFQYQSQS